MRIKIKIHFLGFLKLRNDARHTQTRNLAQFYSTPPTVSGNTSAVFRKSKSGSSVLKGRQNRETCTSSTIPLLDKILTKYSIPQTLKHFQDGSYYSAPNCF